MPAQQHLLLSGLISPDVNHERLFIKPHHGTRVKFKGGVILDQIEIRLLEPIPNSVFPIDLFENDRGGEFSILAHVATKEEEGFHDQLTQPTLTVEKLAAFSAIQIRAFEIWKSPHSGGALDNWFRAERQLLGLT